MVDKEGVVPIMGKQASETVKLIKVHYENILAIGCFTTSENPTNGQWTLEQIKAECALVMDVLRRGIQDRGRQYSEACSAAKKTCSSEAAEGGIIGPPAQTNHHSG